MKAKVAEIKARALEKKAKKMEAKAKQKAKDAANAKLAAAAQAPKKL